jgi:hypothetical protein
MTGCGTGQELSKTDAAVKKFHDQLDAGSFAQIYADSDDGMKKAASETKLTELLAAVNRKLGHVRKADRQGFFVNWNTSGKFIRANYKTQFDADTADEQFVFRVNGDQVSLVGYHINSDALVLK